MPTLVRHAAPSPQGGTSMDQGATGQAASQDLAVGQGDTGPSIDDLLALLTLEEKVSLLAGQDVWRLAGIERLGIPALVTSDGPAGVRGASFMSGRSHSFPCETALAATWDPDLVHDIGVALGTEARQHGVDILLAPTVNLHRHPLGGRNFECFSEDPLLTARMAEAYITGVQSRGVACCVKHFVCNDSEFQRHTISSEVDETTLRELYLQPFEAAVHSGVHAVMASYNKLNGTHTSEHPWLLGDLLRDEWGFDGVVISDWFATHTTAAALDAGLDLEMPGPTWFRGDLLIDAVRSGEVAEDVVDRSARRILTLIARTAGLPPAGSDRPDGAVEAGRPEQGDAEQGDAVIGLVRRAAARSMVLLHNHRGVLPLERDALATVAVIGPGADHGVFQGGGSAQVNPTGTVGILPALADALGDGVTVRFERGCVVHDWPRPLTGPLVTTPGGEPGVEVGYWDRSSADGAPLWLETAPHLQLTFIGNVLTDRPNDQVMLRARAVLHPTEAGRYQLVVAGTGVVRLRLDGETVHEGEWDTPGGLVFSINDLAGRVAIDLEAGVSRSLDVEFLPGPAKGLTRLEATFVPPDPPDLLARAVDAARSADAVIVVAESPHGWETEGRDRPTMTLPGGQDELIAAVAAANPATAVVVNAGAPIAMPWADDVGAVVAMWLPGQEMGNALADVLTGAVNPSGRLPTTIPVSEADAPSAPHYPGEDGSVVYGEGTSMGYRHGEGSPHPAPRFPFGHGLSYSTFELGHPEVDQHGAGADAELEVTVPVTHTGGPAGRHVVQVYISSGRPGGPAFQLQGYAAVDLEPGRTETARVTVTRRQLRFWDGDGDGWTIPTGPLTVYVGSSAGDLPFRIALPAAAGDVGAPSGGRS